MSLDTKIIELLQEYRENGQDSVLYEQSAIALRAVNWSTQSMSRRGQILQFLVGMVHVVGETKDQVTPEDLVLSIEYLAKVRGSFPNSEKEIDLEEADAQLLKSQYMYLEIKKHPLANFGWTKHEESLDQLIYQYEQKRKTSELGIFANKVAEAIVKYRKESQHNGNNDLDSILEDPDIFQMEELTPPMRLAQDFIKYKLPLLADENVYPSVSRRIVTDEIMILSYILGMIPVTVNKKGDQLIVRSRRNLEVLTIKSSREGYDSRINNLQMRIVKREGRGMTPHWWDIIYHTSAYKRVKKFHGRGHLLRFRDIHVDGMDAAYNVGEQYLTGSVLWKNNQGQPVQIKPLENIKEFSYKNITSHWSENGELAQMMHWLTKIKESWDDYLSNLGKRAKVVRYHGRPLFVGDFTGYYSEQDDRELLKMVVMGEVPVKLSGGRLIHLANPEDLYVLITYSNAEKGGAKDFERVTSEIEDEYIQGVFRRTATRHREIGGPTPLKFLDEVLGTPEIAQRYRSGDEAISRSHQDVYNFAYSRKTVLLLGDMIAEKMKELGEDGLAVLNSRRNRSLFQMIQKYITPKVGKRYYDFLEEAALEPEAAKALAPHLNGSPLTRYHVNPNLKRAA